MNALTFEEIPPVHLQPRQSPGGYRGPDGDAWLSYPGGNGTAGPDGQHPRQAPGDDRCRL